jgi:hypothetical protein
MSASAPAGAGAPKRKRRSTQEYSLKAREGWVKRRAEARAAKTRAALAPAHIAPRTFKEATGVYLKEYCTREGIAQQYCNKEAKAAAKAATEKYAHWLLHTAAACAAARRAARNKLRGKGTEDADASNDERMSRSLSLSGKARKARKAHDEDSEADDDSDGLQTVTCADINRAADILREIPHVEDVLVAPKVYRGVASAFVHEEADGNANRSVNQFLLEPVAPFL